MGITIGIIGSVVGILGGLVGAYCSIHNTNGPRERAFMIKCSVYCGLGVTAFLILLFLLPHPYRWFLEIPYIIALPVAIVKCNRIQARIRAQEASES